MHDGAGRLSLILLGGLNLRAQFQPAAGLQIAYVHQVSLRGEIHGGSIRSGVG